MENIKKIISKKWLIVLILVVASILRLWRLDSYPALNADEAAIGYNAYSLIQTGLDEHGNSWPIHFQSFNDYKPGLYVYLVLPFVKLLGLTELAVRLPNALLGIATVFLIYRLVRELFPGKDLRFRSYDLGIAEIGAFLLAISPWHIHFSRGGWEVNVSTLFITVGILHLLRYFNKPELFRNLVLSTLYLVLSLYTYHSARIIVPLIGLGLVIIYFSEIRKNIRHIILAGLIGFVLIIPLARDFMTGDVLSRAAGVGLWADPGPINRINEQRGQHTGLESASTQILHNKPVNYGLAFLNNWSKHYDGQFLFLSGDDIQRNKVPGMGQMYLFDILFIVIGLAMVFRRLNFNHQPLIIIVYWLLVASIAAALTFQAPHALRAQNMVIPLAVVSSLGLYSLLLWFLRFNNRILSLAFYLLTFTLVAWNFVGYQNSYWNHMSVEYPFSSQYGVKELVEYVEVKGGEYDKIIVTDNYDQPYILFLFYLKYPPQEFQNNHTLSSRDEFGFSTVREFDRFAFDKIVFENVKEDYPGALIVGTPKEIPDEANVVKEIYGTNGYEYFSIVEN